MSTSFTAQLARIAATSTHELDTRARRNLHSESLLFPKETAVKQDFDTIYAVCIEGFREICRLDARFGEFERNLFSQQAKEQDRDQMTKNENEAIDSVVERLLHLLSGKILLNPAVKVLEWLVRRFRVHVHNTAAVLLTVLPYHETPIWRNVLSIVPAMQLVAEWKWIAPYRQDSLNLPRHTIVKAMTNNDGFWSKFNSFTIATARNGCLSPALLQFWSSLVVEAVIGRLAAAKSGRREVQQQRMEDALLKVLPMLSDAYEVGENVELNTALSTIVMVLAAKADLDDRVLDTLLQTVAASMNPAHSNLHTAIVTMNVVASRKRVRSLPRPTVDVLRRVAELDSVLADVSKSYSISSLIEACVDGALSSLHSKKRNSAERASFVTRLLQLSRTQTDNATFKKCLQQVLSKTIELSKVENHENSTSAHLVAILQSINENTECSQMLAEAAVEAGRDIAEIEALLGQTTLLLEASTSAQDVMDMDVLPSELPDFELLLASAPSRTADTQSFLAHFDPPLFDEILQCFLSCCKSEEAIQRFFSLPIWTSAVSGETLLLSFLLRTGIGPYAIQHRAIALSFLTQQIEKFSDLQVILPYVMIALRDPAAMVRRASAELIVAINAATRGKEISMMQRSVAVYADDRNSRLCELSNSQLQMVIEQVILPNLEECVLDNHAIDRVMEFIFKGQSSNGVEDIKSSQTELKKSVRNTVFEMIISHAVITPLWKMKLAILQVLKNVHKVGTTTKNDVMEPVVIEWMSFDEERVRKISAHENLNVSDIDRAVADMVSPLIRNSIEKCLNSLQEGKGRLRSSLISAIYDRIQEIWSSLKDEIQAETALKLFGLSFVDEAAVGTGARSTLQAVSLSTNQLGAILETSMSSLSQVQDEDQPRKRRRTSHGREQLPPDLAKVVDAALIRLTLALELIHSSQPENRPELVGVLFDILAFLKRSNQQRLESPYIVNLCLSSILDIVDAQKLLVRPSIDMSAIRADLVVDFIRSSENPQVETTALSLSGSLATLAPDRMLHNVMPIFTFVGQSMFSKQDDHSLSVVGNAIDQIIPPLVQSLRKQNVDMIKSTSGLLSSFAAAYNHIPQHRRVPVYRQLLNRMGSESFAFILLAMLTARQPQTVAFTTFMDDLIAEFPAHSQLMTYRKLIGLANDLSAPQPTFAADIFDADNLATVQQQESFAAMSFNIALATSRTQSLKNALRRLYKASPAEQDALKHELTAALRETLSTIRDRKAMQQDFELAKQCLEALLATPPLFILLDLLPVILDDMEDDQDLKPQVLRVIATQLEGNPVKDGKTRTAAIGLLSTLTRMLPETTNSAMKQAIVICMDRLSEVYGRKDIEQVVTTAAAVSRDDCLLSNDRRVMTLALLSLASMLEVVKEASAPIVLDITNKLISIFEKLTTALDEDLYAAANTLLSSILSHVSFLVAETDLQKLLSLYSLSVHDYSSTSSKDSRKATLRSLAQNVDFSSILTAFQGLVDEQDRMSDPNARLELLETLSIAIESATKASVTRYADKISLLLLDSLDYRRQLGNQSEQDPELSKLESKISDLAIQYVYKLNDTTFRPVFATWIDWAFAAHDLASESEIEVAKAARQISMFGLLTQFFKTLKSIVTSYSGFLIAPASVILNNIATSIESDKKITMSSLQTTRFTALMNLLQVMFAHDADGFFSTPSHFNPLGPGLIAQLKLASSKAHKSLTTTHVIPTIVTLATATMDTPTHHQTLSHHITSLRHNSSPAVRLASIKTLATITADEDVGDEFIANTIGVGSGVNNTDGDAVGIARGGGSSAGELMIYVNEMLEDDDENIEMEVRRWVQSVREKVGEDVFEL